MSNRNISFDIYKEYFEKEDVSQWVEIFSKMIFLSTLESGINVAPWIKFGKKKKRHPIYTLNLYY